MNLFTRRPKSPPEPQEIRDIIKIYTRYGRQKKPNSNGQHDTFLYFRNMRNVPYAQDRTAALCKHLEADPRFHVAHNYGSWTARFTRHYEDYGTTCLDALYIKAASTLKRYGHDVEVRTW